MHRFRTQGANGMYACTGRMPYNCFMAATATVQTSSCAQAWWYIQGICISVNAAFRSSPQVYVHLGCLDPLDSGRQFGLRRNTSGIIPADGPSRSLPLPDPECPTSHHTAHGIIQVAPLTKRQTQSLSEYWQVHQTLTAVGEGGYSCHTTL